MAGSLFGNRKVSYEQIDKKKGLNLTNDKKLNMKLEIYNVINRVMKYSLVKS